MTLTNINDIYDILVLTGGQWVTKYYALDHATAREAITSLACVGVFARAVSL